MIVNYICNTCETIFSHKEAYVIESVGFRIYECPKCGSRLTKPLIEKGTDDDSRTIRKFNRK